jgi:ubiquitin
MFKTVEIKVKSELYAMTDCVIDIEQFRTGKRTFPCGDGSDHRLDYDEEKQVIGQLLKIEKETNPNKIYTKKDWKSDFSDCVPPGSFVDEKIYMDFLESLPPIGFNGSYFQNSEPCNHRRDETKGILRATYNTFEGTSQKGIYIYHGHCFKGEREHRS